MIYSLSLGTLHRYVSSASNLKSYTYSGSPAFVSTIGPLSTLFGDFISIWDSHSDRKKVPIDMATIYQNSESVMISSGPA